MRLKKNPAWKRLWAQTGLQYFDCSVYTSLLVTQLQVNEPQSSFTKPFEHTCSFHLHISVSLAEQTTAALLRLPWRSCGRAFRPGRSQRTSSHSQIWSSLVGGIWLVAVVGKAVQMRSERSHVQREESARGISIRDFAWTAERGWAAPCLGRFLWRLDLTWCI